MNYLDVDRYLIRQRNEEMLLKVRALQLEERLRLDRGRRSGRPSTNNLTWQSVLSLMRRARLSV